MVESEDFAAAFSWICKKCAIILLDHPMCATDNYMVNEDSLARTHAVTNTPPLRRRCCRDRGNSLEESPLLRRMDGRLYPRGITGRRQFSHELIPEEVARYVPESVSSLRPIRVLFLLVSSAKSWHQIASIDRVQVIKTSIKRRPDVSCIRNFGCKKLDIFFDSFRPPHVLHSKVIIKCTMIG